MPHGAETRRLRFGPHAGLIPEQVVLRDPFYVVQILAKPRESVLADIFRGLVADFDARPLVCACARCSRRAQGVCAYPGSTRLVGFCEGCVRLSPLARPQPSVRVDSYEGAVRHVAASVPRGRRGQMRRIIAVLCRCKGGPEVATEAHARAFFKGERLSADPEARPGCGQL